MWEMSLAMHSVVRLGLKLVTLGFQEHFDVLVVCDDSIVNNNKLVHVSRSMWVTVQIRWSSMGCPPGVGDPDMLGVDAFDVEASLLGFDFVLQGLHFPR